MKTGGMMQFEEGGRGRECGWPLDARKGKEAHSPMKPPEWTQLCQLFFRLLTSRTVRKLVCIFFKGTKFVVTCYRSNRKPIYQASLSV